MPIAKIVYDPKTSKIHSYELINPEYLPIHVYFDGKANERIYNFLKERSIPLERKNLQVVLSKFGLSTRHELTNSVFALSLSDQYWINPTNFKGEPLLNWKDINFFTNVFSHDVGDLFFLEKMNKKR